MKKYCIYDLETTGLVPRSADKAHLPGIIQIGAVMYDYDGKELDKFDSRVDPEIERDEWEPGAIKTTGIGPDQVEDSWPSLFAVIPKFVKFIHGANVLGGYNIKRYDDEVLYRNLVRYGFEKQFPWPYLRLDVMDLAKRHSQKAGKRGNRAPKLGEIYQELFGEEMKGWHDALADVRGTARVGFELGASEMLHSFGQ